MQVNFSGWSVSRSFAVVISLVTILIFSNRLQPVVADGKPATPTDKQKSEHLELMLKLAQRISVFEVVGEQRREVQLVEKPVLAYRDVTRKANDSSMWISGREGRPSAIIAFELYPERAAESRWLYEIASLSTERIAVERGDELRWQARQPGLELQPLTGVTAPAEKATTRLAQMRQLRQRFTAHEREGTDGRVELQPLAAPLYRYQDPQHGIVDGAVFAFANGTNPEVLWVIEAHSKKGEPATWQFGFVQLSGAQVFAELDRKEIWTRSEADPPAQRDSYINGWMSAETAGKE